MSLTSHFASAQSYDSLWKTEQKQEEDGKPQSAYATVQTILKKALAEGQQGQVLSARLRAASLHQEWAPDSFFTDIAELEALRAQEKRPEAQAIYASILAEIYERNRSRSQASNLELTSENMKEWTREQYDSAAVRNWQLSLENLEALADARSKDWLPFIAQAANSSYFNHDLLHILWERASEQRRSIWDNDASSPVASNLTTCLSSIIDLYHQRGNREAELLMRLDAVRLAASFSSGTSDASETSALLDLKESFADLPLCTEVYLRLFSTEAPDSQKVEWAREALRRYPRYARIGSVKNVLNELQRPSVVWKGNQVYYPGKSYTWNLTTKNATAAHFTIYRLKDSFKAEDVEKSKLSVKEFFRKNGIQVQEIAHSIGKGAPYEPIEDSLTWVAPEVGQYAILYSATTNEKEATRKTVTDQYQLFLVTSLQTITRQPSQDYLEVIVVDAESGQPVAGATIELFTSDYRTDKRQRLASQQTDVEGRAHFQHVTSNNRQHLIVTASTSSDHYLPETTFWASGSSFSEERPTTPLHLYTDRAIYRPGQTVHLSGIAYTQKHWDASALANKEYEVILRDANWKEVDRQTVKTDELGVFATDFTLPEGRLPGQYRIQSGGNSVSFRVEEYKRPTFEVKMDEAPALQWPQDSIELTGKAMGYNGVPVRDGRVTGQYQFSYPYWWWFRHENSPSLPVDTVATDENGVFHVRVPLNNVPAEAFKYGLVLSVDVEVLSAAGETREGSTRVPLCTTPLRLTISMREQQDRDRLQPPTFSLLTSTGKPATGTINWSVFPGTYSEDEKPATAPMASGSINSSAADTEGLTAALRALPSGDYTLFAKAQAGADTASAKQQFLLFSMADTRLPRHTEEWLYCPTDTFDVSHPARLQVGSSFQDVALYYSLVGKQGIIKDELIRLSDELRMIEIPYLPEYGDGVTAHFAFVKNGTCHMMNKSLKRTLPDYSLRWEWTSFRDRLHPGDHETWTLRLTTPDGKPASANLMATIYDASLDQLTPHSWQLLVSRMHHLRYIPWRAQDFFQNGIAHEYLYFPMKEYTVNALAFDCFDSKWIEGLSFYRNTIIGGRRVGRVMMAKSSRAEGAVLEEVALDNAKPMYETAPAAMAAQNASFDAGGDEEFEDELSVTEEETLSAASPALRTNFNETAAFMPRLHSNPETGEVTLSFTLPESLTTWQLLGIAHTQDFLTTTIQAQAIARKELMARLYLPRFLRDGDQSSLRAVIQNLTESPLNGIAQLEIFDPETEKLIKRQTADFQTDANGETVLAFDYVPTEDYSIVAVRLTAETTPSNKKDAVFSDGEQQYLPILSSKEWITESVEIAADSLGTFTTDLTSLFNKNSSTATQRRLTVEYTTHPIWNVVQALPALREPQYDDVLSLTSAFYANALAAHIAATTPRLKTIIELWKQQASANKSPLSENQELKQLILEETPWLREADNDTERRAQLIDLFNESLVESRLTSTLTRLSQRQQSDGGFSWFPGMRSSELMTRLVCIELTRLRSLTDNFSALPSATKQQANSILQKAFAFVATENARLIQEMKKAEEKGIAIHTGSLMHLHYIYITQRADIKLTKSQQADVRYLLDHLKGTVVGMSNDERAMAAIVLEGDGRNKEARLYFDSMREHMTSTPKHGTFFDYAGGSFTPTGHKVIIHTAAMEAVRELTPNDKVLNSGLRRWLLQQKRTQMWESCICTVNAIYALLNGVEGTADLQSTAKDRLTLNYPRRKAVLVGSSDKTGSSPAALGYIKQTYTDGAAPSSITVQRNSKTEAWGAVYAQYLSPVSDVSAHSNGLSIRRELSATSPRLGDKLTTRYIITADRDYEYVCLRADRAASAEPAEQLSGYRYQGGLGYYRAVRDAHTDYFFDRLPKGTYVLEETTFIDRTGHYTTGLCRIQCIYAPEYEAHTVAVELKTE